MCFLQWLGLLWLWITEGEVMWAQSLLFSAFWPERMRQWTILTAVLGLDVGAWQGLVLTA